MAKNIFLVDATFNELLKTDPSLRYLKDGLLLDIILYGSDKYKDTVNKEILLHTINYYYIFLFSRKFNLKHCLLPITSFHNDYSSI